LSGIAAETIFDVVGINMDVTKRKNAKEASSETDREIIWLSSKLLLVRS
jgi:hypothetical protein